MAENQALVRHKNLTKQIKWLRKQIQESTKGAVDESDVKFMEKQFIQKWKKGNLGGEHANINKMLNVLGSSFKTPSDPGSYLLRGKSLDTRYNSNDPKEVYKFLVEELGRTEKYLGARYVRQRGVLPGIKKSGSFLMPGVDVTDALGFGQLNDSYVKKYDPLVIKAHDDEAERVKNDYLRSTDQGPGFDPDGWRKNLTEGNPHRNITFKDEVYRITGDTLQTTGTVIEEAVSASNNNTSSQKNSLSIKGKNNLTGNPKFGDQMWTGRDSGISFHQANANTRALLINEGADRRQVNLLSNDVLSRFRISGAISKSDRSINLINDDGPMIRLRIRR